MIALSGAFARVDGHFPTDEACRLRRNRATLPTGVWGASEGPFTADDWVRSRYATPRLQTENVHGETIPSFQERLRALWRLGA